MIFSHFCITIYITLGERMLDLIVLGNIPGTQVYITFVQAVLGILSFVLVATRLRDTSKSLLSKQQQIEESSI